MRSMGHATLAKQLIPSAVTRWDDVDRAIGSPPERAAQGGHARILNYYVTPVCTAYSGSACEWNCIFASGHALKLAGNGPWRRVRPQVLHVALVEQPGHTLWLSRLHTRTRVRLSVVAAWIHSTSSISACVAPQGEAEKTRPVELARLGRADDWPIAAYLGCLIGTAAQLACASGTRVCVRVWTAQMYVMCGRRDLCTAGSEGSTLLLARLKSLVCAVR